MGLEEFKSEEKTSSPTTNEGPSKNGVQEFISENDGKEINVSGGFNISTDTETGWDTEVIKIFGGPGTGKTTTMVGNTEIDEFKGILQRMFEQRNPQEVMLIAYTRAAADEAKDRLVKLTDVSQSKADERITTIHSLAMTYNNLRPKDIVEIRYANDKYNFCKEVGMEYEMNQGGDGDEMMATPDDEGHLFFKMLSWLKSKLKPPSNWQDCPLASEWVRTGDEFVTFASKWEDYKSERNIWDFDDAILESVNKNHTIDTKFLFVDEVQDLYPLQQAFLDNQFGHVKRIFLAGDDDQTIYEWAGAKPEYFLEMEGKINEEMSEIWEDKTGYWDSEGTYILDQSWRMPNNILELAKMCINQVDERQDKQIKPHHDGGEFIPLRNPDPDRVIDLINPDDTMILFRAKYQMNEFGKQLIEAGVPFKDRFKTWSEDVIKIRNAIAALKNDKEYMTGAQASKLIKELPDKAINPGEPKDVIADEFAAQKRVPTGSVVHYTRFSFPDSKGRLSRWCKEFESDSIHYYRQQAIRRNLMEGKEHMTPEGIQLETIHGSKGREADTIILSTDSTKSVQENMPQGEITDAERRLYYVGVTRTENRLVMCEGLDRDNPTVTLDQLFGKEWRDKYQWANRKI